MYKRQVIFLFIVAFIAAILTRQISSAFTTNPGLNGLIIGVLAVGILLAFAQVGRLFREVRWVNSFRAGSETTEPVLLAPMKAMIGRSSTVAFSTSSMRTMLDSIATRLDESRDTSRYLVGLLVFLGLLGTFWGLLNTIGSIRETIESLDPGTGDAAAVLDSLKQGLSAPLAGMGTAFSASLFGLSGSLLLGYLDLQAGRAHNRFFGEVEDWLSGQAKLTGGGGGLIEGDQPVPAYIQALLEQTAESLDNLQRTISRTEADRLAASNNFKVLADHMIALTDQLRAQQQVVQRLMETQTDMRSVIAKLADVAQHGGFGIDPNSRTHLRNIDALLARMADDIAAGRHNAVQELRSEIKLLTRTIAVAAGMEQQRSS